MKDLMALTMSHAERQVLPSVKNALIDRAGLEVSNFLMLLAPARGFVAVAS